MTTLFSRSLSRCSYVLAGGGFVTFVIGDWVSSWRPLISLDRRVLPQFLCLPVCCSVTRARVYALTGVMKSVMDKGEPTCKWANLSFVFCANISLYVRRTQCVGTFTRDDVLINGLQDD